MKVQVHPVGTYIKVGTKFVEWVYPNQNERGRVYPITARWIAKYRRCRVCKKKLSQRLFAWALWRYETQVCSQKCRVKERVKRYACCPKAKPMGCVCLYAFKCEKHGETHVGTHE